MEHCNSSAEEEVPDGCLQVDIYFVQYLQTMKGSPHSPLEHSLSEVDDGNWLGFNLLDKTDRPFQD